MESSLTSGIVKNGQTLVHKAADKVQDGIRGAQDSVQAAGTTLSGKVNDLRNDAGPALTKIAGQTQMLRRQGLDAISDATQRARDAASKASDSIVSYTKENPVKALMIAAASGALLLGIFKVLKVSRN